VIGQDHVEMRTFPLVDALEVGNIDLALGALHIAEMKRVEEQETVFHYKMLLNINI